MTEFFLGGLAGMFVMTLLVKGTLSPRMKEMERQAVAHGAAEWVVDQKTGNTTFKWKEQK